MKSTPMYLNKNNKNNNNGPTDDNSRKTKVTLHNSI